jgi:hypothetical protein
MNDGWHVICCLALVLSKTQEACMAIENVNSSSRAEFVRKITPDDIKNTKMVALGQGVPMKPADVGSGITGSSTLLTPPTDEQKAAAKAEDKHQESFARLKVEMRAKNSALV